MDVTFAHTLLGHGEVLFGVDRYEFLVKRLEVGDVNELSLLGVMRLVG